MFEIKQNSKKIYKYGQFFSFMEEELTTSQITQEYIKQNPAISYCLKKGIINYSKLSNLIANELKISKKSSIEAISIASIRYEKSIKNNINDKNKIK